MTLLTETLRNVKTETQQLDLTGNLGLTTDNTEADYAAAKTETFTPATAGIYCSKFTCYAINSFGGENFATFRIKVDGVPVWSGSISFANAAVNFDEGILFYLDATSHTIVYEISHVKWSGSGTSNIWFQNIKLGYVNISDTTHETNNDSGSTAVATVTEDTITTVTPTIPATRTTPVGDIRKYTVVISCYAEIVAERATVFKSIGDSNEADRANIKITVDGTQIDWDLRVTNNLEDDTFIGTNNTYGEGTFNRATFNVNPGDTPVIDIDCYNGFSGSKNVRIIVNITYSPWIVGTLSEPGDFDFPQGSTLYVVLEPLYRNLATQFVGVGNERCVEFDTTNNYFSSSTGVDRIEFSYKFDSADAVTTLLKATGIGAVITMIGVDVR